MRAGVAFTSEALELEEGLVAGVVEELDGAGVTMSELIPRTSAVFLLLTSASSLSVSVLMAVLVAPLVSLCA